MTKRPLSIPNRSAITDDTPLRLEVAAALAFPDGGIKGSSLRLEAGKGRLDVFLIAGRYFTTLAAVARMVEACRVSHGRSPLPARSDDDGRAATANAYRVIEETIAAANAKRAVEKAARQKERDAERMKALAMKGKTRPRGRPRKPRP